ncbi:MAG TPA: glycosyltransferase family 39 protein [Hyphomicrobiales bacterium]|nr:glycosyltransferase family 39 protein [Hyphomicrobiales bacterium]
MADALSSAIVAQSPCAVTAWWERRLTIMAAICLAGAAAARILSGIGQPLWLDEAWTGAIVAHADLRGLLHRIYLDPNAPLYYLLMYGWSLLFGLSDLALRTPSILFGIATPLLVWRTATPGLALEERLTWAVVLASWFPGIWYATDARCYALLLFLCTGQTLAYARLIATPGMRRAFGWTAWSTLAILTHYDAGFLALCQGLFYLAVHRRAALRTWPAALLFLPAAGWIAWHLPRLAEFARPEVAWYARLGPGDLPGILDFFFAPRMVPLGLAVLAVVALLVRPRPSPAQRPRAGGNLVPVTIIAAGLAAGGIVVALGFARPSFTLRYLIPVAPAVLLGLVLAMGSVARRWGVVWPATMAICLCGGLMATWGIASQPRHYSFEPAAADLAAAGTRRLAFAWDNPASPVLRPSQLEALGSFFFTRTGRPVAVDPVVLRPGEDANAALLRAAGTAPRTAILWLYDRSVHDTAAIATPPAIAARDPSWRCRNYGRDPIGVIACRR